MVFKISLILGLFLAASSLHCGAGSVVATCGLPQGVWDPSSPAREQTCIPRTGRQILNPWATREVPASTKEAGPVGRGYTHSFLVGVQVQVPRPASLTLEVGRGLHY